MYAWAYMGSTEEGKWFFHLFMHAKVLTVAF